MWRRASDRDVYEFLREAESHLRELFLSRIPLPISCKSNDAILYQLFRIGEINTEEISQYRKDSRKITYSKEQYDHSFILVTERANNEFFLELIRDKSVHIVF